VNFLAKTFENAGFFRRNCQQSAIYREEVSTEKADHPNATLICQALRGQAMATAFLDSSVSSTDN
jgi:hypothetical protein